MSFFLFCFLFSFSLFPFLAQGYVQDLFFHLFGFLSSWRLSCHMYGATYHFNRAQLEKEKEKENQVSSRFWGLVVSVIVVWCKTCKGGGPSSPCYFV